MDSTNEICRKLWSNDLILRNLFKFLGIQDLKNFRLVNRQWNVIARHRLSENVTVRIRGTGANLHKFLTDFASQPKSRIFFRKFDLILWHFDCDESAFLAFWEKYGPIINTLVFDSCTVTEDTLSQILFESTPILQKFVLRNCKFDSSQRTQEISVKTQKFVNEQVEIFEYISESTNNTLDSASCAQIAAAFPNLSVLVINNASPEYNMTVLEKLKDCKNRLRKIKKLDIFNGFYAVRTLSTEIMERLHALNFSLSSLQMDIGNCVNESVMSDFLKKNNKIQNLVLYRGPPSVAPLENILTDVYFPELFVLEITESVACSLDFLKNMPKLKRLLIREPVDIKSSDYSETDILLNTYDLNEFPVPVLTELCIEYLMKCSVRKLVPWFPHIVKLHIYLDNKSFRMVCAEWPLLEELEIVGEDVTDQGITGLEEVDYNGQIATKCNNHNITALTRLRKFVMRNVGMTTKLHDISVTHGFLLMKSLNYLHVTSKYISNWAWEQLYKKSEILTLIPGNRYWHPSPMSYHKGVTSSFE